MKYCFRCRREIDEVAIFCPHCGARQGADFNPFAGAARPDPSAVKSDGKGSVWIAILAFFVPLAGLLLWYTWRFSKPAHSSAAAKGAAAGICFGNPVVGLVLWLVWRESFPDIARVAGIFAIIGASLTVVLSVLFGVLDLLGVMIAGHTVPEIFNMVGVQYFHFR